MSGIAGVVHRDGRPFDPPILERMTHAIAHRGSDGITHWINGFVALGHLKLSTTPEAPGERQPLASPDSHLHLVLDGRIDNRSQLKSELDQNAFPPRDPGDAELLLRAYQCWGEDCPRRLLGDFAFAIWDAGEQRLFCARDHLGIRPFYYHCSDSLFAFASEIRSLLTLDSIPRRLDESRLVDYLVEELDREDKESTFYRNILRLPAGHSLTVSRDRFVVSDYWNLRPPAVLKLGSLSEYGEAFREVFVSAVRCRLSSSHPVGSTLSGGLDSSSVVCTTRELLASELQQPLHTISLVDADASKCGETAYIREVLRGGRLIPHSVRSDQVSAMTQQMMEADEPFEIAGYFSNWFAFAAARQAGVRVLLDGTSGDHITPPSSYLATLVRSFKWNAVRKELSFAANEYADSRLGNLARFGLAPLMPRLFLALRTLLRGRSTAPYPDPKTSLISRDFAVRMKLLDRIELRRSTIWNAAKDVGKLHCWSFTSGVLPFFFEHTGRMAATMGIETRHPFSDRRVVEFFLSLPLGMKTHAPMPKRVIREGMKGVLPEMVRLRTRYAHPGAAFEAALLAKHADLLQPGRFQHTLGGLEPYVNLEAAQMDANGVLTGSQSAGGLVWQVLNLALWLKGKNLKLA